MSNVAKALGQGLVGLIAVLAVGAVALCVLALAVGWLLPMATAGLFVPSFFQCLALVTLAFLLRLTVFVK